MAISVCYQVEKTVAFICFYMCYITYPYLFRSGNAKSFYLVRILPQPMFGVSGLYIPAAVLYEQIILLHPGKELVSA